MNNSQPVSSKGPVVAFAVILLIGVLLSVFFFILPKIKKDKELAENAEKHTPSETEPGTAAAEGTKTVAGDPNAAPATPGTGLNPGGSPASPTQPSPTQPSPYLTDSVLVSDLVGKLKQSDVAGFVAVTGKDVAGDLVVVQLQNLFVGRKYSVDPKNPTLDGGAVGATGKIWEINLLPPAENLGLGPQKIQLEVMKDPSLGWSVTQIIIPDIEAIALAANAPGTPDPVKPIAPAPAVPGAKLTPLQVAKAFVDAVVARDFGTAKGHVDPAILSDERLAALFIVIEEGKFRLNPEKALIPTVTNEKASWLIVKLVAESRASEFGLEMTRANPDADWVIAKLNFDQLMQNVAASAGAGDIAYTEIRTDLKGGDSLVLFFGFDQAQINPRANRQLEIIAGILKQDPKRTLNINGHADARGDEDYNSSLSDSRAAKVRQSLIGLGVPEAQVITNAFGESAPKAPNFNPDGTDNTSGQAQNRRAEVYLKF
ncbi:MAG: outer membrane protein OmpA-like peptidoglycan-associated protein [Verrucomicrobiales bacterium]|jgi:outer membrane protein OmpA-like peptidoglycan-associated protein